MERIINEAIKGIRIEAPIFVLLKWIYLYKILFIFPDERHPSW